MSKSRDLFIALGTCVFGVLLIASNFADRFITQIPESTDMVAAEFDFDFKMIAAASASAVGPRDGKSFSKEGPTTDTRA